MWNHTEIFEPEEILKNSHSENMTIFLAEQISKMSWENFDTSQVLTWFLFYRIETELWIKQEEFTSYSINWEYISLGNDEKTIVVDLATFYENFDNLESDLPIEEISFDEAAVQYQEDISRFEESIVELEVLSDSINAVLSDNDEEFWETIWEEDSILEWPFAGKTIVEAILIYRAKIIQWGNKLRDLWSIDIETYPSIEISRNKLLDAQEEYLLLSLWIGENREELCHIIPKTMSETEQLIEWVVLRKSPRELLDWMKNIHAEIDANNWQDGTVEENYKYFSDTLNMLALPKIKADIYENEKSENYGKPDLLLEFAVFVSGRPSWDQESRLFRNDIGEYASPMDSRLWDPTIAEEALVYAMSLNQENDISMISKMKDYMDIQDELVPWSPQEVINTTLSLLKENVTFIDASWVEKPLQESENFNAVIESLWYTDIIHKSENNSLAENYEELSLEEMIQVSSIARLSQTFRTYDNRWPGHSKRFTWHRTISVDNLEDILLTANKNAVEHVWSELDKNFDDGFWEKLWEVVSFWFAGRESDEDRAAQFGISSWSIEYQIYTLYNDINGNGNAWEVSDNTRETAKTAGYILAMVAGSMALWWWVVAWLRLASIAVSNVGTGALMWASWSALGYGMDSVIWDARWFYSPVEALTWIGSDFLIWAGTGALWGLLVNNYGTLAPSLRNKWIFAGDLAVLWFWAEWGRIIAHNQYWHGSDIWTPERSLDPLESKILDFRLDILSPGYSPEVLDLYLENPSSQELPSELREYSLFRNLFASFWIQQHPNLIPEFEQRFETACASYEILNPWKSYVSIYHNEPEFEAFKNSDFWSMSTIEMHWNLIEATNNWISRQEERLQYINS